MAEDEEMKKKKKKKGYFEELYEKAAKSGALGSKAQVASTEKAYDWYSGNKKKGK